MTLRPDPSASPYAGSRRALGDAFYRVVAAARPWIVNGSPQRIIRRLRTYGERRVCDRLLAQLAASRCTTLGGPVLVDGTWDNPNYWLRYSLFRAALGLAETDEIGVVGPDKRRDCRATFRSLGIREVIDFDHLPPASEALRDEARALLAGVYEPGDILDCKLPFDFPAVLLYDGILKRQRRASVDVSHGRLESYIVETLRSLYAADRLLSSRNFALVALSHMINPTCGALAWLSIQRHIPTVVLFGMFGVCRFYRIETAAHMFEPVARPCGSDIDALAPSRAATLARAGYDCVLQRRRGGTDDLGGTYAFGRPATKIDRNVIAQRFGWEPAKPIVVLFAPNLFDYPHCGGMSHFRDMADWLLASYAVAERVTAVNWLFRGHPGDAWYGGTTISEVLPPFDAPHVALSPDDWNGAAVQDSADAIITYSGTVAIEAAAFGKPVLIADRGWYHDCGFVKWSKSREEYLRALEEPWWREIDLARAQERARIFAGWYFCCPDWQGSFVSPDDSAQARLYGPMPEFLSRNREIMEREIAELRNWMASDEYQFHSYKMIRAKSYRTPNAIDRDGAPPRRTSGS